MFTLFLIFMFLYLLIGFLANLGIVIFLVKMYLDNKE